MIKVNYYNCARLLVCLAALIILSLAPAAPKTAQATLTHRAVTAHLLILGDAVAPLDLCTACDPHHVAVVPLTDTLATNTPKGLSPQDLQSAYQLPSMAAGYSSTVAIVDVGNAPTLERDLNTYSAQYRLPFCTHITGCLQVVNQAGKPGPLPATDHDWAVETSLDVQMVHAVCPYCRIVLVEADAAYLENLVQAEQTAASFHPDAISNSWGSAEPADTPCSPGTPIYGCTSMSDAVNSLASYFTYPGIAVTVSSGDDGYGYGVGMPANFAGVIAVGGTTLRRDDSARGWSETAWKDAGSGCSLYIAKPAWQNDRYCAHRIVSDVAWVADPQTGVAVFDSTPYWSTRHKQWRSGWIVVGGTSVGAPAIAAVYGLAHNAHDMANPGAFLYQHTSALWDVMGGSNGVPWHPVGALHRYYTDAGPGYDGPSGNGSPKGTSAF